MKKIKKKAIRLTRRIYLTAYNSEGMLEYLQAFYNGTKIKADPVIIEEALSYPKAEIQKQVILSEYKSLSSRKTWTLVKKKDLPSGVKMLLGKLIFKTKVNKDGDFLKAKAQQVVKGFYQRERIDFDQIYAGVVKGSTWKLVLALAAIYDQDIEQMDALIAFLNPDVDNNVYMEHPPLQFDKKENRLLTKNDIYKLQKALYGLKQSPRLQQQHVKKALKSLGFKSLSGNNYVYINNTTKCIIITYVNDFLLTSLDRGAIKELKQDLKSKFEMDNIGPA